MNARINVTIGTRKAKESKELEKKGRCQNVKNKQGNKATKNEIR